ncbi:cytoplasmic dynein 2 light intermediate chain 1 [Anopheles nili]|uniref:cytoplasmic dynein 2 light intermediate chain 1 n=1 Tax=Anopheles nili TaxID=185578 RepID=UPI00237B904A|nr:cytoplasmic dynein 2 light intermediate chain 1 [Anopheles nili]
MSELNSMEVDTTETIQDIAIKLVTEQQKNDSRMADTPSERTLFVLGSKGVGKSTLINRFLDRDDVPRPTLALEYSFGRRTASGQGAQKNICNVWELGSLANSSQLIEMPIRSHGLGTFASIIMLDLSQPSRLWTDLESVLNGLKQAVAKHAAHGQIEEMQLLTVQRIGKGHPDLNTLELFPFPIVIIGGKYDVYQNLDSEVRKHVCRCLRSIAHTLGAALVYYSSKNSSLSKLARDTMNHLGFGSPSNPFRGAVFDHSSPLAIPFGADSWERIGVTPSNSERIGHSFSTQIPQLPMVDGSGLPDDPAKDVGFKESTIDELRSQKDDELMYVLKDTEIRMKFEVAQ